MRRRAHFVGVTNAIIRSVLLLVSIAGCTIVPATIPEKGRMLDHFAENYARETKDMEWQYPDWDALAMEKDKRSSPPDGWQITFLQIPW